jgi:hypothetical protein
MATIEHKPSELNPSLEALKNIGTQIRLPSNIDPSYRMSDYIRQSYHVLDLIPCHPLIAFSSETSNQKMGVKADYEPLIKLYKIICNKYGLDNQYCGIRAWLTSDTVFQDDINSTYDKNLLESTIIDKLRSDSLAGWYKTFNQIDFTNFLQVFSTDKNLREKVNNNIADTQKTLLDNPWKNITDIIMNNKGTGAGNIFADILKGNMLGLPKKWDNTTYSPTFTANVNLVSPYGHPDCVKKYVVEPLLYLLLLAVPFSPDGVTYGYPLLVRVKSYGICNINFGYISNISIRRGGSDVTYNKFRQPLSVDVNFSIHPVIDGLAAVVNDDIDNVKVDVVTKNDGDQFDQEISLQTSFNSIGNLINSFRPFGFSQISSGPISQAVITGGDGSPGSPDGVVKTLEKLSDYFGNTGVPLNLVTTSWSNSIGSDIDNFLSQNKNSLNDMLSSNDLSSLITDMQDKLPSNLFSVPDIANNILPDASDPSFLSAKSAILSSNFNVLGGSLMDKLNINKLPSNFTTALFSNSFSNSINNLLDVGSLKSSSKLTGTVLSLFSNSLTNLIDFHSNIDITDKSAFVTDIGKSSLDNGWKKIEPYIDESERDSTYNALRDSFYSELTKQYNDVSIAKWWV